MVAATDVSLGQRLTPEMLKQLDEVKREMLDEWSVTKRAPAHAQWMHDGTYA